jgi:hypothetical protein
VRALVTGLRRRRHHGTRPHRAGKPAALPLLLLIAALACAPSATGTPPAPLDLHVTGGDTWRADRSFSIDWAPPAPSSPALTLTHYRLRDPQGGTITLGVKAGTEDGIGPLIVPPVPASYTGEAWFEDATGVQGPAATVQLRFDDRRPASIALPDVPDWIGRASFPLHIRLGHPAGPLPISGIRGYAVSIDADPGAAPCAGSDRCSVSQTTLPGGIGDDELRVAALPEGSAYLHAVAVSGSGMKSASAGHAELRVDLTDPVTRLTGAPAGWTNLPVSLLARSADAHAGMAPSGDGPVPFTAIRIDGGTPTIAPGARAEAAIIEEGVHRVAYYARDAAGNVDDGAIVNGVANRPPRTATVRIDRTRPAIAFANSQDPRDPEVLRASIDDALSGPDPSRGWIGVRPAGSGERFAPLPGLPAPADELRARWDSDSYPAGRYEFRATGFDAAGSVAATGWRAGGAAMVLSNPLKATTRLVGSFADSHHRRTVAYGRGVAFGGRLTAGIRSPLAGMPVRIVERFAAGARPATRATTVTTGRDGTYSLRLTPGPGREVTATFAGNQGLSRSTSEMSNLAVRGAVRLRASSTTAKVGGAPLVFRGAVGPPGAIPAGGLPVQLQFRLAGTGWSEFRTVQTDRRGRFRYAYRFSDDDSRGARFLFRAYVPAHENWPYEPAGSRPVLVVGR